MIKKKLQSTEGASLLVALLFFLMCAMAGSVILASASASAGRMKHLQEAEQSTYNLTSAAHLFQRQMEEVSVEQITYVPEMVQSAGIRVLSSETGAEIPASNRNAVQTLLYHLVSDTQPAAKSYSFEYTFPAVEGKTPVVTGTVLKADSEADHRLRVTFQPKNETGSSVRNLVHLTADCEQAPPAISYCYFYQNQLYESAEALESAGADIDDDNVTLVERKTVRYTWSNAVIVVGEQANTKS